MFNKLKNKKGFTLIELIIVMVIIGTLLLLVTPKFLDHIETTKLTQIKNDTTIIEDEIIIQKTHHRLNYDDLPISNISFGINRYSKNIEDLFGLNGKTYNVTEFAKNTLGIKTQLNGEFIMNENGEVVYYFEGIKGTPTYPDIEDVPSVPEIPVDTEWKATDKDFEFIEDSDGYKVDGKGIGYFRYKKENNKIVEIPNTIQGHEMTSYYGMFAASNVEKVISSNKNVENMSAMFWFSQAATLDLSLLDTSNVKNMEGMFYASHAEELDLSSFNTSNVTHMAAMFAYSPATILNLSSFDTSDVTDTLSMFEGSKATEGYARTQEDADRFNNSSFKPDGLTFQVKPQN